MDGKTSNYNKEEKAKETKDSSEEQGLSPEILKNNSQQEPEKGLDSESTDSPIVEAYYTNLKQENERIKDKLKELEDQYLRLLADYQNLQKRIAQEKEELYKYASQKTIEILLPALDTFEYAKQTVKPDSKPEKILEDFNLVFEMLLKCLKDIGLEPIEETGIPFDPVYHEPLHQIPTNELPDHIVMQILKKGYILNKKVIRPALVSVSIRENEKK